MKTRYYAAAGGLVVRDRDLLLLRKRVQNEFVLPKGHVEDGETLEAAALRETCEETGYFRLRVLANLGTLRAQYAFKERWTIRDETYFLMQLLDDARADPQDYDDAQHDAETFEPLWVPLDTAAARLSFEPAKTFAARADDWLKINPLPAQP